MTFDGVIDVMSRRFSITLLFVVASVGWNNAHAQFRGAGPERGVSRGPFDTGPPAGVGKPSIDGARGASDPADRLGDAAAGTQDSQSKRKGYRMEPGCDPSEKPIKDRLTIGNGIAESPCSNGSSN